MPRKYKNKQWLREKYVDEELTMRQIADICGCSHPTILKHLKMFNIDTRTEGGVYQDGKHEDEEWLRQKYIKEEKSGIEMARKCKVEHDVIYRRLRKYGIEIREHTKTTSEPVKTQKIDDEELTDIFDE